ncbi:MAG TPA: NAD(P)/FAD-dependent oxidoreductase [Frankiaceae bacterium]|nr:NAD(P)/FAD-dependent oxidoreductase [Frankiaceae bacterium]
MRDVVVVGAGHNALVAACYLARAGLDVEVVERDAVVGGAVSTVERFPGYRVDRGSSAHIMIRHTGIVEELELAGVGLRYLDCDPWGFAPVPGAPGGGITFWVDLDRTCASVEAVCGPRDAAAYRRFVDEWGRRNERVFEAFQRPPTARVLGGALWRLGRGGPPGVELARQFLAPADALLDASFDDERLKTALAWLAAQSGPPPFEVGTADLLGWNALLHRRPPGRPVGGSGALSEALVRRLEAYGGRVRRGDGAARIDVRPGGRVGGVVTDAGERVAAGTVVAGCHVLTTYELLGEAVPLAERERVRRTVRVGNGVGMVVRVGCTALPAYPGAPREVNHGLVLAARDRWALRAAFGDFCAGRPPTEPAVVAMAFSALDPTVAPPGRHNVSVWGQWYPYELAGGQCWDGVGEREADTLLRAVERVAPGFRATVEHVHVQTPLDLERELGLRRGNVMHVEMGLDSMFAWRPLPELARYRGPLPGLYLTGASTHPGGGVFGASGRSAARTVLADLARSRRRRGPALGGR